MCKITKENLNFIKIGFEDIVDVYAHPNNS